MRRFLLAPALALLLAFMLVLPTRGTPMAQAATVTPGSVVVVPNGTYQPTDLTTPTQSVAVNQSVEITASITLVQPITGTNFTYTVWTSYDNGATWGQPTFLFCDGGANRKDHLLHNWVAFTTTQFRGPALWKVEVSFQKPITVQGAVISFNTFS